MGQVDSVRLGWLADEEKRYALHATATPFDKSLFRGDPPEEFDPRPWLKIENQQNMGSCAGHACSSVLEVCNWIDTQGEIVQLSRMYAYIMGQKESGIVGDRGATISGVVKSAKRNGICLEKTHPYPDPVRYTREISDKAHAEAAEHKLINHSVLEDYDDVYKFIASGVGAVEIGIKWVSSLRNNGGVVDRLSGGGGGGHALAIVGWTKRKDTQGRNYLIMANSHGTRWGKNGFAEIAPRLFDQWGEERYSEMIGMSDLQEYGTRSLSFVNDFDWGGGMFS